MPPCLLDILENEKRSDIQSEVNGMSKKNNLNKGKKAPSVTPQGNMDTEFGDDPKSKLENAAKKKNTK